MFNFSHVPVAVPQQANFLPALQFLQRCLTLRWDRKDTDKINLVDNALKYQASLAFLPWVNLNCFLYLFLFVSDFFRSKAKSK